MCSLLSSRFHRYIALSLAVCLCVSLSGCMGAPIAQQLASSLMMRAADRASSEAYEAHLRGEPPRITQTQADQPIPGHGNVANASQASALSTAPQFDQYWSAFLNAGFTETAPEPHAASADAQPPAQLASTASVNNTPSITSNALIGIETWNLLLGEEKLAMLKQALLRGKELPPAQDWRNWQVAVGASKESPQTAVTFLVPPELGYLHSGQEVMVELATPGDIGMARYLVASGRP